MTRIDFYVLPEDAASEEALIRTVCRLCDKAVCAGQRVYLHAPVPELADALDRALWSFRQGGFIAHERAPEGALAEPFPDALIGSGAEPPPAFQEILIPLSDEVAPFFSRFERVLEFVHGGPPQRAASRARYKFYRDRGYPLASHQIAA